MDWSRLDYVNDFNYDPIKIDYSMETEIQERYHKVPFDCAIPMLTARALGMKYSVYKKMLKLQEKRDRKRIHTSDALLFAVLQNAHNNKNT